MHPIHAAAALALALVPSAPAAAQDWPSWRGPTWNGATTARGLPTDFDRSKHVRWVLELAGPGAGTPIVVGERVFVTAANEEHQALLALAVDRSSGELLWERAAGSGYVPADKGTPTRLDYRVNYAAPSPVADAERAIFFYGNGDLIAYDHAGEEEWRRNVQADYGDFAFQWSFSASPTLWDGKLFLPILQRDTPVDGRGRDGARSFLLAMDPATGETIYERERPSDARIESRESYATAIPHVGADGRKELFVVGGDVITGHDPASGEELWRWGTWNPGHREEWWRVVPSAVAGSGVVLACAPKNAPVYAVKLGGEGVLGEDALAWKSEGRPNPVTSDVPTPLFMDGRFYVLSDLRETLSCVDPASGRPLWTIDLPGEQVWRASPTGADGKIWCMSHHGNVVVVEAESGKILADVAMGDEDDDGISSSIAIAHGEVFVRTSSKLYCIARAAEK